MQGTHSWSAWIKCLIQKSPCRSANGKFCASGAHVPKCTLRSGYRNHHFRHGLPLFDSDTKVIQPLS
ncbi:hypothetical protein FIC94_13155 [Ochrobactrum teleogrylli]|uniref:Uncharacterized protein n=1 Tax=Ochrobactrum teleogrylli TaxID=2479765 RepID=A0ABY2Y4A3_9HYPH|nr:hypothetical protein FIC94_13155 [[Ochrobactrum] teleogrylli]